MQFSLYSSCLKAELENIIKILLNIILNIAARQVLELHHLLYRQLLKYAVTMTINRLAT